MPPPLPDLIDDIIAEILLRDPALAAAHLFRAALVCKPWRRILTDPSFLSRYRAFHRAPPVLGYIYNPYAHPVQTSAFVSPLTTPAHDRGICRVCDCRHGRVLMYKICSIGSERLVVWDPITGGQKKLSVPKKYPPIYYAGAVLCAVDGCDHLDCHAGAFLVVYCGTEQADYQYKTWLTMYSSETGVWSSMISIDVDY